MPHREACFTARDGLRLYEQTWLPDQEARAAVILVHGFAEHSARHARTAKALRARGYAIYAHDLRGHGRSDGPRCFVRRLDQYLNDLDVFAEQVRGREPGKPLFLLGHSLGGLIAARWCIVRRPQLAGTVLIAPALRLRGDLYPWLRHLAGTVAALFPGLRLVRMGFGSISRDPAVVAEVRADPLVFHGRFPVRTGAEILRAMRRTMSEAALFRLPLLVLQGTADRVSDPAAAREFCERVGSADKTLQLYDGLYHEVLSEPEREQVLADLIGWLEKRS